MASSDLALDRDALARTVTGMASAILARTVESGATPPERLALVGIRRGGVPLAQRLAQALRDSSGAAIPVGTVDIALYRDDAATALPDPKIGPSEIAFDVEGMDVVLVDDVLQTGRTIRAAIDCLLDYGRPRRVWLAVLFDRGGRELPIAPDVVGQTIELAPGARLEVELGEGGALVGARVIPRGTA